MTSAKFTGLDPHNSDQGGRGKDWFFIPCKFLCLGSLISLLLAGAHYTLHQLWSRPNFLGSLAVFEILTLRLALIGCVAEVQISVNHTLDVLPFDQAGMPVQSTYFGKVHYCLSVSILVSYYRRPERTFQLRATEYRRWL
ncbi:hypothetical protein F4818DRAFT_428668 [Hypoxylon cercidicola]|nr:hypothetical protein F4818DRAFT_428668 [Hypoxylon cercidicola]